MADRKNIQLAYPFEERRLKNSGRFHLKWYPPYIVQPKLNGERCRLLHQNGRVLLLSSSEEIISSIHHINAAGQHLPNGEYDGELYIHGWKHSEIHSVVSRTNNIHPRADEMQLHLFDIPSIFEVQCERIAQLNQLSGTYSGPDSIRFVKNYIAHTFTEVLNLYDQFIGEGYEGFIIRHLDTPYSRTRTPGMMKFKPEQSDTYTLTGMEEAISESGTPLGMVGAFNCIDDMGTRFKVGAGKLTHAERRLVWQEYLDSSKHMYGKVLLIEYQTMSDKNKVPLFSRAVKVI